VGEFVVDVTTHPGVLHLRLKGLFSEADMAAFVAAHDAGVDVFRGKPYRVFCDLRELAPLSPECTQLLERAKSYSARMPNFQGSAVLVTSSLVAMQHRRTSAATGVQATELVSDDEQKCWEHLKLVSRAR
jgi:hypothetical protein